MGGLDSPGRLSVTWPATRKTMFTNEAVEDTSMIVDGFETLEVGQ